MKFKGKITKDHNIEHNGTYTKKTTRYVHTVIPGVSWRRAKAIAKQLRLMLKGTDKKRNVKWTNYYTSAGYSRPNRCMHLIYRIETERYRFVDCYLCDMGLVTVPDDYDDEGFDGKLICEACKE